MLRIKILLMCLLICTETNAQSSARIGCIYPAGGQRGTTKEIYCFGRNLSGAYAVHVTGDGVQGRVVQANMSFRPNNSEDGIVVRKLLMEARQKAMGEKPNVDITKLPGYNEMLKEGLPTEEQIKRRFAYVAELDNPTLEKVQIFFYEHFMQGINRMTVDALRQSVRIELTIDANASPGDRELRLRMPYGISMPIRFIVGHANEVDEIEPNDANLTGQISDRIWDKIILSGDWKQIELPPQEIPVTLNGKIRPGDVDRFLFNAKKAQKLTIRIRARHLMPYLADAVPGWAEAALNVFDANGKKVDVQTPFRFDPDPVLFFTAPETGIYSLVIQDSIFRGRDDFVYRLTIDQSPYVTGFFPLGCSANQETDVNASVYGWLLPKNSVPLSIKDSPLHWDGSRQIFSVQNKPLHDPIRFAVDSLPEIHEKDAGELTLPIIINGRIDKPNEMDEFTFFGKSGQKIVCDVTARRLGCWLDASLLLLNDKGDVIAENDDRAESSGPNVGLDTHHCDPYILHTLPNDGKYTVRLFSTLNRSGNEYGYRLRISEPMPDFAVLASPSAAFFSGSTSSPFEATVIKKDGFEGEIKIQLKSVALPFAVNKNVIPKDAAKHAFTLTAGNRYRGELTPFTLEATAVVNGKTISHDVIPADKMEQAFIYHHLLPAETFFANGREGRR